MSNEPERTAGATADEDDDDPIVATYSVFVKPPLPQNKKLVVFNYMSKAAPDHSQLQHPQILGLRVKPETGMYEVDIPIDISVNYDKTKGITYGTALAKSKEEKKDGTLGFAGGFGIGAPAAPRGGRGNNAADEAPLTWGEAHGAGKVLTTQTLSGGRKAGREYVRNMLGVVQGKNIHLTPASSVVALRPVANHLDALAEQERRLRQQGGPGGPGDAGAAEKSGGRAIHMTLKGAMDESGGVTAETIGDRLRGVQKEPWKTMDYYDDECEASWAAYKENLLLRTGQPGTNSTDKGKGKEVATDDQDGDGDDSGSPELAERVPYLKTDWEEDDLLRAMAGIGKHDKKPGEEAAALSQSQAMLAERVAAASDKAKGKAPADPSPATAEPPAPTSSARGRARPARGGATAAATRGGRTERSAAQLL